ncbi:LpqB family beta-propeller domain-containing protein [Paenibacillus glufosinatiresistens]|uniref:LpqB family beta-propeller domain-containing protein n=1 Tax=Paenibacillus glufosinatiresistens TaxID=3070657 RepID=UPI00286E1F7E|nr:LpqB family beta-propeller domain-containing protein [Paenibacillus sp. YX.27]
MKKSQWLCAAAASALILSQGAGSVHAAGAKTQAVPAAAKTMAALAVKEGTVSWTVNGRTVALQTIDAGGYKLYAAGQVAAALGARLTAGGSGLAAVSSDGIHTVVLKTGSSAYTVDGQARTFSAAPVSHKGRIYVQLGSLVNGLGGEVLASEAKLLSAARPQGEFDTLRGAADSVIATREDATGTEVYRFSPVPGSYSLLTADERAADFTVSPDGRFGAFTDDTGQLSLINLATGAISPAGTDTSVKTDLFWSADGSRIYVIQGDKQEKLAAVDASTGALTELLADKVENKSELRVSADGTRAVYIVNLTGTAKNDADSTEASLTIDYSQAGEQLYSLDLTKKDAKPVQLTNTPDNKLFPELLADGSVVYLSADAEGSDPNVLKRIKPGGAAEAVRLDMEPSWMAGYGGGLIVSGTAADGTSRIYTVTAGGTASELLRTSKSIDEVAVSPGGGVSLVSGGKLWFVQNGKAVQLTR